ncbi:glycosyltransferase family 4 protein [Candidatus Pelagibacter sp.]|nr:glycosyltransferase family 4 protein [Candidatus Pelagibacter sp.]
MKKKIIFLVNTDSFLVSHRLPIADKMLKSGYEVHIATEFSKYKNMFLKKGFKVHNINFDRNSMNIFKSLFVLLQIFHLIFKFKPDILHLISLKPIVFGGLISFIFPIKLLVFSITGLGSMFIKNGFFFKIRLIFFTFLYRIVFLNSNLKVILQNNDDLKYLVSKAKLNKSKVIMIKGSGVNLKDFKPSKISKKFPIVLMASRLIKDKGVEEFIKAANYLKKKNFKGEFYLVGDVDLNNPSAVSRNLISLSHKQKILRYFKYKVNISKFIKKSTIVVLPSYREGFPKILMEAAACGRPIITTNVPGCKDAIINNKTGILVPSKNYKALANAINKLSQDKKQIEKFASEARKYAMANFNIKDVISKHFLIYQKLKN